MTKLEKLYSIIENSREVGVKLSKDVLQQVENWSQPFKVASGGMRVMAGISSNISN